MAQEIIYTSAPQGLRPGTYGFCTVAATAGMPGSLIERLEALSGYRHLFPPGTPEAAQNPVVYSHVVLKLGTRRLHVVSRVADAGLDYSQRSNKLAHHVALEENEVPVGGPAWLSSQGNLFHTQWNGAPRTLPAARTVPQGLLPPLPCPTWARLTGDAGWAGLLAQHAFDARRPAYVIVPAGADALALLREAQALLPERKRWEVSYSTCFTKLPAGVDCLWRCVVAGTPEAEAALAQRSDLVIDASHPLPPAPAGRLVTAARTGELPPEAPRVAEATRAAAPPRGGVAAPVPLADDDLVAMPPLVRGGAAGRPTLPPPRPQAPPALKRKRTWRSRAVLALGMLLMIGGLGTAGYYLAEQGSLGDLFADVRQYTNTMQELAQPPNMQAKPTALPTADTSASAEVPPMPPPVPAAPGPATPGPATPGPATPGPATPGPATPVPATPVPAAPVPAAPVPAAPGTNGSEAAPESVTPTEFNASLFERHYPATDAQIPKLTAAVSDSNAGTTNRSPVELLSWPPQFKVTSIRLIGGPKLTIGQDPQGLSTVWKLQDSELAPNHGQFSITKNASELNSLIFTWSDSAKASHYTSVADSCLELVADGKEVLFALSPFTRVSEITLSAKFEHEADYIPATRGPYITRIVDVDGFDFGAGSLENSRYIVKLANEPHMGVCAINKPLDSGGYELKCWLAQLDKDGKHHRHFQELYKDAEALSKEVSAYNAATSKLKEIKDKLAAMRKMLETLEGEKKTTKEAEINSQMLEKSATEKVIEDFETRLRDTVTTSLIANDASRQAWTTFANALVDKAHGMPKVHVVIYRPVKDEERKRTLGIPVMVFSSKQQPVVTLKGP